MPNFLAASSMPSLLFSSNSSRTSEGTTTLSTVEEQRFLLPIPEQTDFFLASPTCLRDLQHIRLRGDSFLIDSWENIENIISLRFQRLQNLLFLFLLEQFRCFVQFSLDLDPFLVERILKSLQVLQARGLFLSGGEVWKKMDFFEKCDGKN